MIYVGLDDTDTLDHPGTNKLARHLSALVAHRFETRLIVRHQLLSDPRIPCTNKNGCASLLLAPIGQPSLVELREMLQAEVRNWAPPGSDPGLAVAANVPAAVTAWGRRCQREVVAQREARQLAAGYGIFLAGLGGTEDGVIGALAAIGLLASRNDGRVIQSGPAGHDRFDVSGMQEVQAVRQCGVDRVLCHASGQVVDRGPIDLGKRLRPNLRGGQVVLFVEPHPERAVSGWSAVRVC